VPQLSGSDAQAAWSSTGKLIAALAQCSMRSFGPRVLQGSMSEGGKVYATDVGGCRLQVFDEAALDDEHRQRSLQDAA
jgi:hypothetical protein